MPAIAMDTAAVCGMLMMRRAPASRGPATGTPVVNLEVDTPRVLAREERAIADYTDVHLDIAF
jgi:hypothetical protein